MSKATKKLLQILLCAVIAAVMVALTYCSISSYSKLDLSDNRFNKDWIIGKSREQILKMYGKPTVEEEDRVGYYAGQYEYYDDWYGNDERAEIYYIVFDSSDTACSLDYGRVKNDYVFNKGGASLTLYNTLRDIMVFVPAALTYLFIKLMLYLILRKAPAGVTFKNTWYKVLCIPVIFGILLIIPSLLRFGSGVFQAINGMQYVAAVFISYALAFLWIDGKNLKRPDGDLPYAFTFNISIGFFYACISFVFTRQTEIGVTFILFAFAVILTIIGDVMVLVNIIRRNREIAAAK